MNLGPYQKEITIALLEATTFGTAATPLLLAIQQRWQITAAVITMILGILGVAKTLYAVLTGSAVQSAKAPVAEVHVAPGDLTAS